MKAFSCWLVMAFVIASFSNPARAQEPSQTVLQTARSLYTAGKYDSTISILKTFIKKNGKDPSTEYLVPLLMEALSRTGETEYSLKLADIYAVRFPQSDYTGRVRYLEGIARSRSEDFRGALIAFSRGMEAGYSGQLDSLTLANVRLICERALTGDELAAAADKQNLHPRIRETVLYYAIFKTAQAGPAGRTEELAGEFGQAFPRSPYLASVKDLVSRTKSLQKGQVPVGLLAPISGYDADLGKKIVQGVQLAVDRFNQSGGARINLIICDTKSNMVETARKTRELIQESKVPVIIGPVLSQEAVVTAALVADKDVVMITPTATEDGIAELGPNIFQVNVTTATLGRRIAAYAMNNLNIKEFAVITPSSDYGRILSESFRSEVTKNGGEIVDEEAFDEGANDFKAQFKNLRMVLAKRKWDRENADLGYGARRSPKADSLFLQDSSISIGGMFIPAETDDVVMLAPQVFFYKLKTQILGATGWHNSKTILDGKQYVNNAVVVTSLEPDKEDPAIKEFRSQYMVRTNSEPDRVAALGYDAAELICTVFRTEGTGCPPARIIKSLQAVKGYRGVSGLISFDQFKGVNTEAAIVKISDKQFLRVQ
jgi:ABC-type branched-subunit amino acid transport system substrate-binding protein